MVDTATTHQSPTYPVVGLYSFGTRTGHDPMSQFEFDVSKLRDPAGQKQFSISNGMDTAVHAWLAQDDRVGQIVWICRLLASDMLAKRMFMDREVAPASTWVSFSFKDYHGKFISPAVACIVAEALKADGFPPMVYHLSLQART